MGAVVLRLPTDQASEAQAADGLGHHRDCRDAGGGAGDLDRSFGGRIGGTALAEPDALCCFLLDDPPAQRFANLGDPLYWPRV